MKMVFFSRSLLTMFVWSILMFLVHVHLSVGLQSAFLQSLEPEQEPGYYPGLGRVLRQASKDLPTKGVGGGTQTLYFTLIQLEDRQDLVRWSIPDLVVNQVQRVPGLGYKQEALHTERIVLAIEAESRNSDSPNVPEIISEIKPVSKYWEEKHDLKKRPKSVREIFATVDEYYTPALMEAYNFNKETDVITMFPENRLYYNFVDVYPENYYGLVDTHLVLQRHWWPRLGRN